MTGAEGLNTAAPAVIELGGIPIHAVTEGAAADLILRGARDGRGGHVITPNVDILRTASRDRGLVELFRVADLVIADGAPLVWAARLQRTPLPERVAGSSLARRLIARAAEDGPGIYLLGGNPGSAERASHRLGEEFPGLRVGWACPSVGFEHRRAEVERIQSDLGAFGRCICFCGLGFPKQDIFAEELRRRLPQLWFVGAGATIGFLAGEFARAPNWMQRAGLEWVHRLLLEPSRLSRRYLQQDLPFAVRLLVGAAGHGIAGLR